MHQNSNTHFVLSYLNGRFVPLTKPEKVFSLSNPAYPSHVLASTGWNKNLVQPLIEGMIKAQQKLKKTHLEDRLHWIAKCVEALKNNREKIKSNMMLELARSKVSVEEEWELCETFFRDLDHAYTHLLTSSKEKDGWQRFFSPLGMVLISTNISLPIYSLLSSVFSAFAGGNAICVRPSMHSILSSHLIASSFQEACFPEGAVQFIYGDFDVFRKVLLSHPFDVVLYTGIEENLEQIRRDTSSLQNIRLVLCAGGKNAAYISESAVLHKAISSILYGAFVDAGQRLESTGLVFVHQQKLSQLIDPLISAIKAMPIGAHGDHHPSDVHVMEPLCGLKSWERFLRFQGIAARESAETLRWGKHIDNSSDGYFVSPGVHLMSSEKVLKSVYASNPFFGPDICVVPVKNAEEMTFILDHLKTIRSVSVHSEEQDVPTQVRNQCSVPTVLWNEATTKLQPLMPSLCGGSSGYGGATGIPFVLSTVAPHLVHLG